MQKSSKILLLATVILTVVGLVFVGISKITDLTEKTPRACTEEAKICPDGSAVGRTGPDCEFSECPKTQSFGVAVTLKVHDSVTFGDGLKMALSQINDSRCKPNVVCIWAGELSVVLSINGGKFIDVQQVTLGTTTNPKVTQGGYVFELKDVTDEQATIIVSQVSQQIGAGCYVGGCSSEVCLDQKDVVSNCIYKEEFGCYKTTTCEKQKDGKCGWTQTDELRKCLNEK